MDEYSIISLSLGAYVICFGLNLTFPCKLLVFQNFWEIISLSYREISAFCLHENVESSLIKVWK